MALIPRDILEGKIHVYGSRPEMKPQDRLIEAVTRDGRKLQRTAGRERLALDRKI